MALLENPHPAMAADDRIKLGIYGADSPGFDRENILFSDIVQVIAALEQLPDFIFQAVEV
jgi:hypothetical protein